MDVVASVFHVIWTFALRATCIQPGPFGFACLGDETLGQYLS